MGNEFIDIMSKISIGLIPYILGAIFGIIALIASGFLKEKFDERNRIKQHKLNVAQHTLQVIIEASTHNYSSPPRDMEDIYSLLANLKAIDPDISIKMTKFISLWQNRIGHFYEENKHIEADKYIKEIGVELDEYRSELEKWASSVRMGNK